MSNQLQAILDEAGITEQVPFVRASGGQRNETWLNDSYVIRLTDDPDAQTLAREADLLQHIAGTIPAPTLIAFGHTDQGEWMLQERVTGIPLAQVWRTLAAPTRHAAVRQLAEITQTLHRVPCDTLSHLALSPNWLTVELPQTIQQLAEQSKALAFVDLDLMDAVINYTQAHGNMKLTADEWGLIHGDLHFDNVLWDGEQIVALLDFEKACYAPLSLELDLFLRYCAFPALFVAEEFEHLTDQRDYQQVPFWFQQAYPQLFRSPTVHKQLALYSLYYDLRLLQMFPPRGPVDPNEDVHLINRIRAIVEQNGYLSTL